MDDQKMLILPIFDPGQDTRINVLKVPTGHTYTIEAAEIMTDRTLSGATDTGVKAFLEDAGTAGTAQTVISGTVGGTDAGGTFASWAAQTPKALSINSGVGDLTEGHYLALRYDETGTIGNQVWTLMVRYVDGIGSKA